MPQTRAHIQATTRYESKTYEKVTLRLRKDTEPTRETIAAAAERAGESLNGYILQAVKDRLKEDNAGDRGPG